MTITAINISRINSNNFSEKRIKEKPILNTKIGAGTMPIRSIYNKSSYNIAFGENMVDEYVYNKLLEKHIANAKILDPRNVEEYFYALGIPCDFRAGSDKARKVVAYCAFNAAEMLRQINMVLPVKITMGEMNAPEILAGCYYTPNPVKNFPIRTVEFNTEYDWDNHMEKAMQFNKYKNGVFSSGHFIQTFLHEFGHNIHNHHLYSKFGCPFPNQGYYYNPNAAKILEVLNMPIYDPKTGEINFNNGYVTKEAREAMKTSSIYGSTLLPEVFAEEFARALINCMDYNSLRLKKNPLPIATANKNLNQVLYETWEGLVADNEGIIR